MAEAPSSPPSEKLEALAGERGQSKPDGSPSCPATTPPPAQSSTATAVSSSSSPTAPAAGASGKSPASKSLAITVPARANSDTGAEGGRGDGECRSSFSQLLAGAMASPLGSSLPMSLVAVPVEGVRVPVVAVPCFIAPAALLESPGFTSQFGITHQAVLASVTAQAQVQVHTGYANSSVSTSTAVTTQPSPTSLSDDNVLSSEAEPLPSSKKNDQSSPIILNTTAGDRFNWRKYGQKQVKSSENSRSYYRCTQTNCSAKKKVECCQDGRVVEVVYKGGHNHNPPEKVKCSKERKRQAIAPFGDTGTSTCGSGEANGNVPSQPKLEQDSGSDTPEQQLHCSSDCEADAIIKTEGDLDEEPDFKRRLTERQLASQSPRFKAAMETKVVIRKASDARSSNDGYKWRKYGQKLVKGNPNPRSYYKCTHVGCPARKHVERDSADAKALIIHYEGKHNHDLPTPKDGSAPAAALLIAAAAAAAARVDSDGCIPSLVSLGIQEQPDVKSEVVPSEKASELEGDKTLESAQALLSIGLKPTPEDGRRAETDADPRPLFDENHVVSVQNS